MSKNKRFSLNDKVKCPVCNKDRTVKEWNDFTYEQCINRKQRKTFGGLELMSSIAMDGKRCKYYYYCMDCRTWVAGNRIRKVGV